MTWKVPPEKIRYSREPIYCSEYTARLDGGYTRFARLYDAAVKMLPFWKTWLKQVLPHITGPRVLEASFGTGYLLCRYARRFETYGIDFNHRMVDIARRNLKKIGVRADLRQADVRALPFENSFFDSVVNTMAFSGYPSGRLAMTEFSRVLKPGGKLVLLDFDYPADRNLPGCVLVKLMEAAGDIIRDIGRLLSDNSFQYEEQEIGGFGSVHIFIAKKRSESE